MKAALRDAAVALSLANLCYITAWSRLLDSSNIVDSRDPRIDFVGAMLNVVVLAALVWPLVAGATRLGRPWGRRATQWAFLLVALVPLNGLRVQLTRVTVPNLTEPLGQGGSVVAGAALAAAVVVVLRRWSDRVVAWTATGFLLCAPFVALTFGQAAWILVRYEAARSLSAAPAVERAPAGGLSRRVLWLVFDAMDQRLSFQQRPRGLRLTEFDRLCREALCASEAYPPGGGTALAMPALIVGRVVSESRPRYPNDLMLRFVGARRMVRWSGEPTVFSKALAMGVNTGVVGWYLPYCAALGEALTSCSVESGGERGLPAVMASQAGVMFATVPGVWRFGYRQTLGESGEERRLHTLRYFGVLEAAKRAVTDPDVGLLLVHWPVPHEPYIYDRLRDEYSLDAHPVTGYLDNLRLADRALGEIRRVMEQAGTWEETTVLITADHSWSESPAFDGKRDFRVPFVLKPAGQREPVAYHTAFNTLVIHDLVLALLRGDVATPRDAVGWLDRRRLSVPRPGP